MDTIYCVVCGERPPIAGDERCEVCLLESERGVDMLRDENARLRAEIGQTLRDLIQYRNETSAPEYDAYLRTAENRLHEALAEGRSE